MTTGDGVLQAFRRRAMCRSYLDKSVPVAHLHAVLDLARKAPSAGHSQGVRFAVLRDHARRREVARAYGEEQYVARGFEPWLSVAPVHLVVAVEEGAYIERYDQPDKHTGPQQWEVPYPVMDAGQALMTLYAAAQSFGLGTGFLGAHAGPDLVALLKLPDSWRYLGLVTLGYASGRGRITRSSKRGWKDYSETVLWLD